MELGEILDGINALPADAVSERSKLSNASASSGKSSRGSRLTGRRRSIGIGRNGPGANRPRKEGSLSFPRPPKAVDTR